MNLRRIAIVLAIIGVGVLYLVFGRDENEENDMADMPDMEEIATQEMDHSQMAATASPEYRTLSIDEFGEIVNEKSDEYTIVNVHIPYEGEVANTDYHVAYNDIDALTSTLPDKDAPIILYCRSGNMSRQASEQLVELGYTQVWDVPGGMVAWENDGREILMNE